MAWTAGMVTGQGKDIGCACSGNTKKSKGGRGRAGLGRACNKEPGG